MATPLSSMTSTRYVLSLFALGLLCGSACGNSHARRDKTPANSQAGDAGEGGRGGDPSVVGGAGAAGVDAGELGGTGGEPEPDPPALVSCPKPGAVSGFDSWVRIEAPAPFSADTAEGLRVSCGDEEILGTIHVDANRVAFEPAAHLPLDEECSISLPAGQLANGQSHDELTFSFSTGDTAGTGYAFEAPRPISSGGQAIGLAADGDDVLVYWDWGDFRFAVSHDAGETFGDPV